MTHTGLEVSGLCTTDADFQRGIEFSFGGACSVLHGVLHMYRYSLQGSGIGRGGLEKRGFAANRTDLVMFTVRSFPNKPSVFCRYSIRIA